MGTTKEKEIKFNIKVGYDARTFNLPGGSKTYGTNLITHYDKNNTFLFGLEKYGSYNCVPSKIKPNSILRLAYENITIPYLVKKNNIKLFHGLKGIVPYFGKFIKIITVHDLVPIIHPESMKFKDYIYWNFIFPIYLKKADRIICISKSTQNDLLSKFNVDEDKIRLVYQGISKNFKIKAKKDSYENIHRCFKKNNMMVADIENKTILLSVNVLSPRKNIARTIEAFDICAETDPKLILFIVGKKGWAYDQIFNTYRKTKNTKRIFFMDYVEEDVLISFYNVAKAFVYPSLYEGFGLPILEAQACGCPVITSNVSSMPEVAGEGAILVDPYSVEEIASAISKITSDDTFKISLSIKGFNNCMMFSWEKCAEETLKVYEEVCNEG
ncbi:glycosyltransferase family 1 protein [Methanococcoides sp. NM1]|uniref:glycosyltransferase family 4 protein n=1 Tax=Methanococcoides sp. NM1 TaxID=1201013 RepID=UPI0014384841|nr:glycosyltransferase family 1 protein [Methanococcoides sp. NM1]